MKKLRIELSNGVTVWIELRMGIDDQSRLEAVQHDVSMEELSNAVDQKLGEFFDLLGLRNE